MMLKFTFRKNYPLLFVFFFACLAISANAQQCYSTMSNVSFNFIDISATGAVVASGDDTASGAVTLGKSFPIYGTYYDQINAATNGYLTTDLSDGGPDLSNDCPLPSLPSTPEGTTGHRIYPFHDDVIATIYYQYFAVSPYDHPSGALMGASIFHWDGVHFGGGVVEFEAILFDNGDLVYMINQNSENGNGSTSGIQNGNLSSALVLACDTSNSANSGTAFGLSYSNEEPTQIDLECQGVCPAITSPWNKDEIGLATGEAFLDADECTAATILNSTHYSAPNADAQEFVYQDVCGSNVEIITKVAAMDGLGWAGIQIRESMDAGAKKVAIKTQLRNFVRRDLRVSTNAFNNSQVKLNPATFNWLKLERNGNFFKGYTSNNGTTWKFVFSAPVSMGSCVKVGLITESINPNHTTRAGFIYTTVTGNQPLLVRSDEREEKEVVSVAHVPEAPQLTVYPNPATAILNITANGLSTPEVQLQLLNSQGQLVVQNQYELWEDAVISLNVQDLPKGLYLVSLSQANGMIQTKKVWIGK